MLFFMNQSKIAKSEIDVVDIHVVELLTISSMIMRAWRVKTAKLAPLYNQY